MATRPTVKRISASVPATTAAHIAREAQLEGCSVSAWIAKFLTIGLNTSDREMLKRERVLAFFLEQRDLRRLRGYGPKYYTAADVARALSIAPQEAGNLIQLVIPLSPVKKKGYLVAAVDVFLAEMEAEVEAGDA